MQEIKRSIAFFDKLTDDEESNKINITASNTIWHMFFESISSMITNLKYELNF